MALELIIGIGICAFLVVYFAFAWDRKEHYLLQLLASFFFIFLLILIPKVAIDSKDTCEIVIANETTIGNTTSYEHDYFCETNARTTTTTFYKVVMWFMRLFLAYLFLYFNYVFWIKSKIVKYKFKRK